MSPWRKSLYAALSTCPVQGVVIDLGGDRRSGYHELLRGAERFETVNIAGEPAPDHAFDLEKPFELGSASYDTVLALNIMEHIYNHEQFLSECRRVLKPEGMLVLAVPFLMQVHPSPKDYYRYTEQALRALCEKAGLQNVRVTAIGKGPFTAASNVLHNPVSKIPLVASVLTMLGGFLDDAISLFDTKGTYSREKYPLGYLLTASV